jgi:uncharacterized protein with FMN-binding domain
MKRVALALFGTVAGLVMLLGFKTHSPAALHAAIGVTTSGTNTGTGSNPGTATSPAPAARGGTSSTGSSKTHAAATGPKTYTGSSVDTQYGPVQVQITVSNGKITAANAIEYPTNGSRDQQINSYAIPQLNSEAVSAQSANIDMVSGASYTSDGYAQSLQSALDQAGL